MVGTDYSEFVKVLTTIISNNVNLDDKKPAMRVEFYKKKSEDDTARSLKKTPVNCGGQVGGDWLSEIVNLHRTGLIQHFVEFRII